MMNESVPSGLWVLGCLRFMYFFVSLGAVAGTLHHLGSSFSGSWVLGPGPGSWSRVLRGPPDVFNVPEPPEIAPVDSLTPPPLPPPKCPQVVPRLLLWDKVTASRGYGRVKRDWRRGMTRNVHRIMICRMRRTLTYLT